MTWYGLASFKKKGEIRTALVLDDQLYDLARAARTLAVSGNWVELSVNELLARWPEVNSNLDA